MSKNAVATIERNNDVALQSDADVFAAFEGQGFENVGANDLLIPRLTILQALSPALKKNKASYVQGASEGDILDTGTGELMPNPMTFLPVYYRMDFLEWAPRESGKGLQNIHTDPAVLQQARRDERGKHILPNGNYIAETAQMFGLNMSANGRASYIAFTSTQLKRCRQWLTIANGERIQAGGREIQPPLFYRTYLLGTASEEKNGNTWAGWTIGRGPLLTEVANWRDVMKRVTDLRASLQSGSVQADTSSLDSGSAETPL